jgi:hypothetical protein
MHYIDQLCEEEINLLDERISSTAQLTREIANLIKDTQVVRSSLELAVEFSNRKQYADAYRCLLHSLNYIININQQILDKVTSVESIINISDDNQET